MGPGRSALTPERLPQDGSRPPSRPPQTGSASGDEVHASLRVDESLRQVGGLGRPDGGSYRTVPLPPSLARMLTEHIKKFHWTSGDTFSRLPGPDDPRGQLPSAGDR